jgi:hypothetical protein
VTAGSVKQVFAAVATAAALALALVGSFGTGRAQAANTSCGWSEGVWACNYYGNNWPAWTELWFDSGGNNLRSFRMNSGYDSYGGTVYKCMGYMDSGGGQLPRPCSTGNPVLWIPEWRRPGYVFMYHGANGPRSIRGYTTHGG